MAGDKKAYSVYLPMHVVDKVRLLCGHGRPYSSFSDCISYLLERELSQYADIDIENYDHIRDESNDNLYVPTQLGPLSKTVTKDEYFYACEQTAEHSDELSDDDRSKYYAVIRQWHIENPIPNE
jgi:Arc/MetJ-type ribon-helix-helix transcriptional regulator